MKFFLQGIAGYERVPARIGRLSQNKILFSQYQLPIKNRKKRVLICQQSLPLLSVPWFLVSKETLMSFCRQSACIVCFEPEFSC